MMMIYQQYEVERVKSITEQRAAAGQRGEVAAAVSRSVRGASRRVRALAGLRLHVWAAERQVSLPSWLRPAG